MFCALVEKSKADAREPCAYLHRLFETLPSLTAPAGLETLLPHRLAPDDLKIRKPRSLGSPAAYPCSSPKSRSTRFTIVFPSVSRYVQISFIALILHRVMHTRLHSANTGLPPERAVKQLARIQNHRLCYVLCEPVTGVSALNTEQVAVFNA